MSPFDGEKNESVHLSELTQVDSTSTLLSQWFESPLGKALLDAEQSVIEPVLMHKFGYHILQIGCSDEHSLIKNSPVGHKIQFSSRFRPGSGLAVANNEELPLATDSMDVVLVHHALDFTHNSHRLLREATRVLRPGGKLLIVGFNPFSSWGLRKTFSSKAQVPWKGSFISSRRVVDWLKLLDLHIEEVNFLLHFLPFKRSGLLKYAAKLEAWGNKFNSPLGGAYFINCSKQVLPITPILQRWRPIRSRGATALPATENVRARTH